MPCYIEPPVTNLRPSDVELVIIERPTGWVPKSEHDRPRRFTVLEVEVPEISAGNARAYRLGYNAMSMDHGGKTWLVARRLKRQTA